MSVSDYALREHKDLVPLLDSSNQLLKVINDCLWIAEGPYLAALNFKHWPEVVSGLPRRLERAELAATSCLLNDLRQLHSEGVQVARVFGTSYHDVLLQTGQILHALLRTANGTVRDLGCVKGKRQRFELNVDTLPANLASMAGVAPDLRPYSDEIRHGLANEVCRLADKRDGKGYEIADRRPFVFQRRPNGYRIKGFGEEVQAPSDRGFLYLFRLVVHQNKPFPMLFVIQEAEVDLPLWQGRVQREDDRRFKLPLDVLNPHQFLVEAALGGENELLSLEKQISVNQEAQEVVERKGDLATAKRLGEQSTAIQEYIRSNTILGRGKRPRKQSRELTNLKSRIHGAIKRACSWLRENGAPLLADHFKQNCRATNHQFYIYGPKSLETTSITLPDWFLEDKS